MRLAALALLALPAVASAQAPTADSQFAARATDVAQVLAGKQAPEAVFDAGFLAAVPPAQVAQLAGQLVQQFGPVTGADAIKPAGSGGGRFVIRFARGQAEAAMQLEPAAPFKVAGLRILSATPLSDSPQAVLEEFGKLPGEAGFALVKLTDAGPQPVLSLHPAQRLAIGSEFKLWVLDAVAEEVAAGRLKWEQVVRLGARSLPSGVTQDWPVDAPVTVETLATLMISISDNTATDTLMRLVGREAIAARVRATGGDDAAGLPFLTTAEAFALKLGPETDRARYAAGDEAARTAFLGTYGGDEALKPGSDLDQGKPNAIRSLEWHASANAVTRVLDSLRRRADPRVMAILGVSPGVAAAQRAKYAALGYKGGSEPGVIAMSWVARSKAGDWYAVAAAWNDGTAPVDNGRFALLAQRLLSLVP